MAQLTDGNEGSLLGAGDQMEGMPTEAGVLAVECVPLALLHRLV